MLIEGKLKGLLKDFVTQVNQSAIDGNSIDNAIETYAQKMEDSIYTIIRDIEIIIPPGGIVVEGSPSTQTNALPIVLNNVIN